MPNKLYAALILAAVAVAGCSDDGGGGTPASTTGTSVARPTTTLPTVPVFDWSKPSPVDLGGGWRIEDCEGDAPLFCVRRNGDIVGPLEALRFELEGKSPEQQARAFLDTFREDRLKTCPGHGFATDPIVTVATADGPAIRYGFTLTNGQDVVERVIQFAGERDGKHVVIAANAVDEGGCLAREGEFATDNLIAFDSRFEALVRVSGLP